MAKRRMFSLDIVDTDKFLDMPVSAQSLYFHLGMRADDDGFINSPRKITSIVGCNADDLRILISKEYVIPFQDGIIVIKDWCINNFIRKDRYSETMFKEKKQLLSLLEGRYEISDKLNEIPVYENGQPNINQVSTKCHTQVRLGKGSIDNKKIKDVCSELNPSAQNLSSFFLPLVDKTMYYVPMEKLELWKQAYPAVDIEQQLLKMRVWLEENPTRKKTKRGIGRFITTWLSGEQDKGGIYRNGAAAQAARPEEAKPREKEGWEITLEQYIKEHPDEEESGPFK